MSNKKQSFYSPLSSGDRELLDAGLFPQQDSCFQCDLFEELNRFRRKVNEGRSGLHHYPYTVHKNKVTLYQMIFFTLTIVFLGAGFYVSISHFNWVYYALFGGAFTAKSFFCAICGMLGISTATIGVSMQAEQEIAMYCVKKAHRKIKKICEIL